jgi:molybdopterin-guanine dinucleotide biosynthesis protein A
VLCGGMSRRMGRDKGSMLIHGKPMIIHILEILNYRIDEVIIVLNDRYRISKYKFIIQKYIDSLYDEDDESFVKKNMNSYFDFNILFLEDEIKNKGPLSGIMTGLKNISSEYGLVIPCDSPFIKIDFINTMFKLNNEKTDYDSIVPYHGNKLNKSNTPRNKLDSINSLIDNSEPLHSIYKKNNSFIIEKLLSQDIRDVKSLIKKNNSYFVNIEKYFNQDNFKNINKLDEL